MNQHVLYVFNHLVKQKKKRDKGVMLIMSRVMEKEKALSPWQDF